jgi:hypothetical protein
MLVTGSRHLTKEFSYDRFKSVMDKYVSMKGKPSLIVHGGAPGADNLASHYAYVNKINLLIIGAQWGTNGNSAGPKRNILMLEEVQNGDICMAFPTPESRGTVHMIGLAKTKSVAVWETEMAVPPTDPLGAKDREPMWEIPK